jgi:hypothetical protein
MLGPAVLIVAWSVDQRRSPTSMIGFVLVMAIITALVVRMNRRVAQSLARRIAALDQTRELK